PSAVSRCLAEAFCPHGSARCRETVFDHSSWCARTLPLPRHPVRVKQPARACAMSEAPDPTRTAPPLPRQDTAAYPTGAGEAAAAARPTGRCELGAERARGGMGAILDAVDSDLQRRVAVKVLLPEHHGRPELERRFLAEARISSQLEHPGVVPVYALGH